MQIPLTALIRLVQKVIDASDPRIVELLKNGVSRDIYFSAPDVVLRLLESAAALAHEINDQSFDLEKFRLLDHTNIIPSFDWSITLFHKDYPLYRYDWMIRKIALDVPAKINEDKIVVYVNEVLNDYFENAALN